MIDADKSDLYDVLAYIAFSLAPVTRAERVDSHRARVMQGMDYRQQEFLAFVLDHYVQRGIGEHDTDKLPHLIELFTLIESPTFCATTVPVGLPRKPIIRILPLRFLLAEILTAPALRWRLNSQSGDQNER